MSKIEVNTIEPQSGTTVTLGASGDTTNIIGTLNKDGVSVTNTPAFRAYVGSNQTVSDATDTKIALNTEVFDTDGAYDTSNYRFTVPSGKGGKYYFGYQMWAYDANAGTSNFAQLVLRVNNSALNDTVIRVHGAFSNHNLSFAGNAVLDLSAGDYVEAWAYLDFSTSTFVVKANNTVFSGYKLIGA